MEAFLCPVYVKVENTIALSLCSFAIWSMLVFFLVGYYMYANQQNSHVGDIAYIVSPVTHLTRSAYFTFMTYLNTHPLDVMSTIMLSIKAITGDQKVCFKVSKVLYFED